MDLRASYRQPGADSYSAPGGAWDIPRLGGLLAPRRRRSAPAIIDGDVTLDVADLDDLASRFAAGLAHRGVRAGDVVAWQMPNWWEAIVAFHGCWRIGAVAAPIHHQLGRLEVERLVSELQPHVTLAAPGMPLAGRHGVVGVRADDATFAEMLNRAPLRVADRPLLAGSAIAVVLFTSGSTGYPKAVLHTHRGLGYKAHAMVRAHGLKAKDVALMPSPLAHISGLLNSVLVPAAAAMPVVLMEKWDAQHGVALAALNGVSFMIGPPTMFLAMLDVPECRDRVKTIRVVSCGSMGVTPEFIDEARHGFGAMVKRTYGSTEAPTITTSSWRDSPDKARDTDGHVVGSAGVKVAEPGTTRGYRPGQAGEVLVRGPELFVGYGQESQTRHAVRRGWFATGDLGTLDADGWLTIVGRLKDLIIRGGENIAAAEVERVLERHPDIRQAVVVAKPDTRYGERVAAFIVSGRQVDLAECRRWFEAQGIAKFKTPEVVVQIDEMPTLGVGKPDRSLLARRAAELSLG